MPLFSGVYVSKILMLEKKHNKNNNNKSKGCSRFIYKKKQLSYKKKVTASTFYLQHFTVYFLKLSKSESIVYILVFIVDYTRKFWKKKRTEKKKSFSEQINNEVILWKLDKKGQERGKSSLPFSVLSWLS